MNETNETNEATDEEKPERQWPVIIKLKSPVELGSERITSLEFRRGRFKDLRGLKMDSNPSFDTLMTIASRLSGQPSLVIEKLDVEDVGEVMDVALDFFGRCLTVGA